METNVNEKLDDLAQRLPGLDLLKKKSSTEEIQQWMKEMEAKVDELNMRVARTVVLVSLIQQILEKKGYVSQQDLINEAVKEMNARISG